MALEMLATVACACAAAKSVRAHSARILLSGARKNADAMVANTFRPDLCRSFAFVSLFMTQACRNGLGLEELPAVETLADVLDAVNALQAQPECSTRPTCAEAAAYFIEAAQFAVAWAQRSVGDARRTAILEAFFYASTAEFYILPIAEVKDFVRLTLAVYCAASDTMLAELEKAGRLAALKLNV